MLYNYLFLVLELMRRLLHLAKRRKRNAKTLKTKVHASRGFVIVYQDDICIFSTTLDEHMRHMKRVFEILSVERIPINPAKACLACRYVRYLGCICGQGELHLDPSKVEAIQNMPTPTTPTEIKSFLDASLTETC